MGKLAVVQQFTQRSAKPCKLNQQERDIDQWNCILPSLGHTQQADREHNTDDSLFSLHLVEHSGIKHRGQCDKFLSDMAGVPSVTAPPAQVPWHKMSEAQQ